jgi:hypothetical protein
MRPYDHHTMRDRHLVRADRAITVNDDGLLTGVSTDPEEDDTLFIGYLPLSLCQGGSLLSRFISFQDICSLRGMPKGLNLNATL